MRNGMEHRVWRTGKILLLFSRAKATSSMTFWDTTDAGERTTKMHGETIRAFSTAISHCSPGGISNHDSRKCLLYYSGFHLQVLIMSEYEKSKKVRRIASVIYLLIMAMIMGGTYLSQQQKEAAQKEAEALKLSEEIPGGFSQTPTQN